ncbi:uncharacterized protein LOC144705450 isoform X2 [Wolffia australiana]
MSDDSRGGSPDWLRNFQTPITGSILSLSSDSSSSHGNSSNRDLQERDKLSAEKDLGKSSILIESGDGGPEDPEKGVPKTSRKQSSSNGSKRQPKKKGNSENHITPKANLKRENDHNLDEEPSDLQDNGPVEDDGEKPIITNVSSRLPLVMSDKVQRSKALVECDDDSVDLSGDVGAVGRVVISETGSRSHEMLLDLKGTIYKTAVVPSRTFCVVSFGPSEAKAFLMDFPSTWMMIGKGTPSHPLLKEHKAVKMMITHTRKIKGNLIKKW